MVWNALSSQDMIVAVVSTCLGTILGIAATLFTGRAERVSSRKRTLADHVDDIAELLTQMTRDFREGKIPHTSGRAFRGLYGSFEELLRPHLSEDARQLAATLQDLADQAGGHDEDLYSVEKMSDLKPEKRDALARWILGAERLSGDLKSVAGRLRLP